MTDKQNEAAAKAKIDAEAKTKAEAESKAKAEARVKLDKEAKSLEIKRTKINIPAHSKMIKDMPAEIARHERLSDQRLAKRIAKKNAKVLPPQAARKLLLLARLTHWQDHQKKMVAQWRWELNQMAMKQWRPGQRMPKGKKSVYQDIMDED